MPLDVHIAFHWRSYTQGLSGATNVRLEIRDLRYILRRPDSHLHGHGCKFRGFELTLHPKLPVCPLMKSRRAVLRLGGQSQYVLLVSILRN
jgi:hypothetical protein